MICKQWQLLMGYRGDYRILTIKDMLIYTGWWFQTFFHNIWDVILPIDFHIF